MKVKRSATVETEYEINLPYYCRTEWQFFRLHSVNDEIKCTMIALWSGGIDFDSGYSVGAVPLEKTTEITAKEWLEALDNVYNSIENMLNDMVPQGPKSAWMVHADLIPLIEPVKEN